MGETRVDLVHLLEDLADAYPGDLEETVFDPGFDDVLRAHDPEGVRFVINGHGLDRPSVASANAETAEITVRIGRRRKPSAVGVMMRRLHAFPDDRRGIAISTLGKVIKRGWDWLGLSPAAPERISGLIEVPELASCLTLNKVDFLRAGPRGATYMAYRKALQQAVSDRLTAWGDSASGEEQGRRRAARPVERDLESILIDLADEFPLLALLVERRSGGARPLPAGAGDGVRGQYSSDSMDLFEDEREAPTSDPDASESVLPERSVPDATSPAGGGSESDAEQAPERAPAAGLPSRGQGRRPVRLGLTIQFESRSDDRVLGRLVETTVWVNEAHAAYRRAVASRSEGYHLALAVAMALAEVAVEPAGERAFVTEFMARWGESTGRRPVPARGTRRRR